MKHILITGVGGNVGQYVAQDLHLQGYSVIGICRNTEPHDHGYKLIHTDLANAEFDFEDIDTVIHVAASLYGNTEKLIHDNVIATTNLVKFAEKKKVRRFLYISSVSVYGKVTEELKVDSDIVNPEIYGVTKYIAENLVKEADIPVRIIIGLPRMLGPFVDLNNTQGSGFLTMTKKILKNEDVTCFIPDVMYNNYMHVSDLAHFLKALLEKEVRKECLKVLLGAKDNLPMTEILKTMKEAIGSKSRIIRADVLGGKAKCALINIDAAVELGYNPSDSRVVLHKFMTELSNIK